MNLNETINQYKIDNRSAIPENGARDTISQFMADNESEHQAYKEFIEKLVQINSNQQTEIDNLNEEIQSLYDEIYLNTQQISEVKVRIDNIENTIRIVEYGNIVSIILIASLIISQIYNLFRSKNNE